jgi:hypothetical protein
VWLNHVASAVAAIGRADVKRLQFGAHRHQHRFAPPLVESDIRKIEVCIGTSLPPDYRDFVANVAGSGAGPYYGLIALQSAGDVVLNSARLPSKLLPELTLEQPHQVDPWAGAIPICHLGCGYAALLIVNGPAVGQIWLDARGANLVAPIAPSFRSLYEGWIDRAMNQQIPLGYVPSDACPLPHALAGFLANQEVQRGVAAGDLTAHQVRVALGQLAPGAIRIAATVETPLWAAGYQVDECVVCRQLITQLGASGLNNDVIARLAMPGENA